MSKVLTTFGFGAEHEACLRAVLPGFAAYAAAHGYDLFVPSRGWFARLGGAYADYAARPASWWKVPLLHSLLDDLGYDLALWLDADVAVCRTDRDVATDLPAGAWQGMVVHSVDIGGVPNCGVWPVRRVAARRLFPALWARTEYVHHGFWEQAANIRLCGSDPEARPIPWPPAAPTALFDRTAALPYEWNPHPRDGRGVPADARFKHATTARDRPALLQEWTRE